MYGKRMFFFLQTQGDESGVNVDFGKDASQGQPVLFVAFTYAHYTQIILSFRLPQ